MKIRQYKNSVSYARIISSTIHSLLQIIQTSFSIACILNCPLNSMIPVLLHIYTAFLSISCPSDDFSKHCARMSYHYRPRFLQASQFPSIKITHMAVVRISEVGATRQLILGLDTLCGKIS